VRTSQPPRWSSEEGGYVDSSGWLLPTWEEALAAYEGDLDWESAHVIRFGEQDDLKGLLADTPDADRHIGYLCKYLTKDIAATHDDGDPSPARETHINRLAEEVRWLPCSPEPGR
jgi:hypothetical protein